MVVVRVGRGEQRVSVAEVQLFAGHFAFDVGYDGRAVVPVVAGLNQEEVAVFDARCHRHASGAEEEFARTEGVFVHVFIPDDIAGVHLIEGAARDVAENGDRNEVIIIDGDGVFEAHRLALG